MAEPASSQTPEQRAAAAPGRGGRKRKRQAKAAAGGWQPPRLSGYNGYSRFVGLMKLLLPAVAVSLALMILVWPQLFPEEDVAGLSFNPLDRDQAQSLSMVNAHFQGRDEEDRPYQILADLAEQLEAGGEEIDLTRPKADLRLEDGNLMALSSDTGRYWRDARRLVLDGKVHLTHDDGFVMDTDAAEVDLRAGNAWGDQAVNGSGPSGDIEAEGFRLENRGETITFTGRSHLTLRPQAAPQNGNAQDDAEGRQ